MKNVSSGNVENEQFSLLNFKKKTLKNLRKEKTPLTFLTNFFAIFTFL